mmetsp:Transcript_63600/g.186614  ORF Transcript_63600/g.186614 Transcript_63600/m.186614 type:complete len:389 (+) Transcript_63600:100-1266(+)
MGNLASSCVRDCVRTSHEYASEELLHVSSEAPGLASSGSRHAPGLGAAPSQPSEWKASSSEANVPAGSSPVPPVPNWFQVLAQSSAQREAAAVQGTPRFEEVMSSRAAANAGGAIVEKMTPRGNVGGEFQTPRPGPGPGPTPRDSPRGTDGDGKSDEVSYEGPYLGTMKHGRGKLRMTTSSYEGDFVNDSKHGIGVLSWDDGRRYTGGFEFGMFHGSAAMTWPDGRRYSGQYSEDKKHGEGTFSWQDGRRYEGQWVFGKRHGVGIYTNAKGLTRRGMWQTDRPLHWEAPEQGLPPNMDGPSITAPQVAESSPSQDAAPGSLAQANAWPEAMDAPNAADPDPGSETDVSEAPPNAPRGMPAGQVRLPATKEVNESQDNEFDLEVKVSNL